MKEIFSIIPYGPRKKLIKFFKPSEAKIYFYNYCIDLIREERSTETVFDYIKKLDDISISEAAEEYEIHHLFYELSDILLFQKAEIDPDIPLAIEIKYIKKCDFDSSISSTPQSVKAYSSPCEGDYKELFYAGREELIKGNSYQFNLTQQFKFDVRNFCLSDWVNAFVKLGKNRGQFAHLTVIPSLNKVIFSNSPEGLFQLRPNKIGFECITTPIKGTVKRDKKLSIDCQWNSLIEDPKNQAELFMIIDLLRNDLSAIESPTAKVIKRKAMVKVPGIIHQMGIIKVRLTNNVKLGRIIRSLFPGGSITGAPKKNTYRILKRLESNPRGLYTGSTMLRMGRSVDCSINIRTAEIDTELNEMSYGSGGGITLLSDYKEEYLEMHSKVNSFIGAVFKS